MAGLGYIRKNKSAMQQTYVKRIIKLKKPLENTAKIKKYDP